MRIKRLFYCTFVLFTVLLLFNGSPPSHTAPEEKQLVFAGNNEFAPYSYIYNDIPVGYSIDLTKILSAYLILSHATEKDINIKLMPWEDCISELENGTVDGLIGAPVYGQRKAYLDYSVAVTKIEFAIFVEAGNSYVNSLQSLKGTVVGVRKGDLATKELLESKHIKLLETGSVPEALEKLKAKEVTAVIAEKNVALYYIQQGNIQGLKIVGSAVKVADYALAVRKDNSELLARINDGINTLEENGTLDKLKKKWFGIRLEQPFPWKMVSVMTAGMTGLMLILGGVLWMISLNATVKVKTERIQMMSQRMVEKDKLAVLGKLAGQIAHELRTPLGVINNSVYLLRKEGSDDRSLFEKRLSVLQDKVKLSSNILESILSYSRVKAEVATAVSIKECIEEVLKDLEAPEGIKIDALFEKEEFLMVFMDFHQLYSVIRNVALNALQAMGDEGKLTIKAFPSDNNTMVSVSICDTGHGVAEGAREKIFRLFYTSKITGTGLGLPISKSIIEANDGQLLLKETSEKGSCFLVKLPFSKMAGK